MEIDDLPSFERNRKNHNKLAQAHGYAKKRDNSDPHFRRQSCIRKRAFKDEARAKEFRKSVKGLKKSSDQVFDETRIYHCSYCNKFHLAHVREENGNADVL